MNHDYTKINSMWLEEESNFIGIQGISFVLNSFDVYTCKRGLHCVYQ